MASMTVTVHVRERRPQMWRVVRPLKPLWRALPHRFACWCLFTLLDTQSSIDNGRTWKDIR